MAEEEAEAVVAAKEEEEVVDPEEAVATVNQEQVKTVLKAQPRLNLKSMYIMLALPV